MKIEKKTKEKFSIRSSKLHSPAHLLADELAKALSETERFGFYLKMAMLYDHNLLRKVLGEVKESAAKNPGALFTYLLNKQLREKKLK